MSRTTDSEVEDQKVSALVFDGETNQKTRVIVRFCVDNGVLVEGRTLDIRLPDLEDGALFARNADSD